MPLWIRILLYLLLLGAATFFYAIKTAKPDPHERPGELTAEERQQQPKRD